MRNNSTRTFFLPIVLIWFVLGGKMQFSSADQESKGDECKDSIENSPIHRLKRYLFCKYDSLTADSRDTKGRKTAIIIEILPRLAIVEERHSNLELYTWMHIGWKDEHLRWEPENFDNITKFNVETDEIWTPDLDVQSPGNEEANANAFTAGSCVVFAHGMIGCMLRVRQTIRCQTDLTFWPYDRQNCTLIISSWSVIANRIEFEPLRTGEVAKSVNHPPEQSFDDILSASNWKISISRVSYDTMESMQNYSTSRLSVDFTLERSQSRLASRFVSPGIILTVMSLTTVWLDTKSKERLVLAGLNPVIHLMCIQDLNLALPHDGNTVPIIALFYTSSLLLTIVALLLTIFFGKLSDTKISPPRWISASTEFILQSKFGGILLICMLDPKASTTVDQRTDDLVNSHSKDGAWSRVIVILSWIVFIAFFIAYIVMWTVFVPSAPKALHVTQPND